MCCKVQCDTVNHAVNPLIHTVLHAGINQKESLVWFKAPGLHRTIDSRPSLGHPPEYPAASLSSSYYSPWPSESIPAPLHVPTDHRWVRC